MSVGYYFIVVLLLATFSVMMLGIILMGIGGKANRRYGNTLMVARVSLQGLALAAIAFLFAVSKN